jgi:capsular polysaccharide biosynthesis protein
MIEKLLEAFFRHVALIILPIVVIPLVVAAAMLSTPPQYEAQAGMWVEQATYLSYSTDDINRYLSPATNQRNRLVELMQTRSFLAEVASGTPLAAVATSPGGDAWLRDIFARDFEVAASGDHLLTLRFRSEDRAESAAVLAAMVSAFKERAAADRYAQAQVAINFYQTRLNDATVELAAARVGLSKYLAENPALAVAIAKPGDTTARFDFQFAEAQNRVDTAQRDVDGARASLERAELDVAAGMKGLELGFRLVDPVTASESASRQLRKILIYPIAALVLGVVVGASLLVLFALSDHSVRSLADLGPDAVILGVVPRMRAQGVARRAGPAVVRRAIGFLAGSQLRLRDEPERRAS